MGILVKDILRATSGKLLNGNRNDKVYNFSIDSRNIKKGDYFIAIKGKNFDGHSFLKDVIERGVKGCIVEKLPEDVRVEYDTNVIEVKDTTKAMGIIASEIRRRVNIPVICVTGTNGKTTVKDILSYLLSAKYKVLTSRKSYNNLIGVSLTLFDLNKSYDVGVLEVGTNHPGEIASLASIIRPHMAVITNIGDGHLEAFQDRQGVFIEKSSLLTFIPEDGMAFLNRDDIYLKRTMVKNLSEKYYGFSEGSDFRITRYSRKDRGYRFSVNDREYFAPVEGKHNLLNICAAIAVAEYFGLSYEEIRERLRKIKLPAGRLEKVVHNNITFLNDSYNANPNSFECALSVLEEYADNNRNIKTGVVAGDMYELGVQSEEFHRMIGRSISSKNINFLIARGQYAQYIAEGAIECGMNRESVFIIDDYGEARGLIESLSWPESVVLIKGSRSSKMEEVLKCFTISCTP